MSDNHRNSAPAAKALPACGFESALRLLIHARNNHGALREQIRATIHADVRFLRELSHV